MNLKDLTNEQLEQRAASLNKTVGNPYASRDAERRAYNDLCKVEREQARREAQAMAAAR